MFGQVSEMTTFMATREVFYKQRRANFYRTLTFVVAYLAAATPVVCSDLVYWMCGFVAEIAPFLVFLLGMILSSMALSGCFVVLSALSPSAQSQASLATVFVSVFVDFVVPLAQIPIAFSWLYWINPVSWCLRSVLVSQYRSSIFQVCDYECEDYCKRFNSTIGEYLLSQYDVPAQEEWVWGGLAFLVLAILLFVVLARYILERKRFDHSIAMDPIRRDTTKCTQKKEVIKLALQLEQQYSDFYFKIASEPSTNAPLNASVDVHDKRQFNSVTVSMMNLCYSVKTKNGSIDLLKGVSGYALPGTMTALMGSTGAGKTTLLDVVAGRKTGGVIRGEIRLNDRPATERAIKYCTGYCEQQDIHSEATTIRETLSFSAFLRQDSRISAESKRASLKRVTIGVELAAQPSVLFLDEPTSEVDAHSAKIVMDGVRKMANSRITVVCTIHHPSPDIFFFFDNLLLLRNGGEVVFFGELVNASPDQRECGHLIDYFEAIPGVPRLPEGQNPVTWVLESIGAGIESLRNEQERGNIDFVHRFRRSREYQALSVNHELYCNFVDAVLDIDQRRFFTIYWRTPSYNITRLAISLGLGLIFGLLLFRGDFTTYQGISTAVGVILMTTLCQGNIMFESLENEHPFTVNKTLKRTMCFVGSTLEEIPYAFTSGLLFSAVFYPLLGFTSIGTDLLYWINVSLFLLVEIYLGQFLVYALPTLELGTVVGALFNSFFCFSLVSIHHQLPFLPCTSGATTFPLIVARLYTDCPQQQGSHIGCEILENAPLSIGRVSVKEYIDQVYNIKHDYLDLV
ncbi:ABC transporter G family member 36 [Phytophthora citrophthora]|uniref:ABC transporter G family member 36 n=1 Tax=Phytophthora citrophthora TaxID=4793 RepID=A0AAD9LTP1_9STRA|nr:ABC transporter G family member 36 [Phytophthora citrophthora]